MTGRPIAVFLALVLTSAGCSGDGDDPGAAGRRSRGSTTSAAAGTAPDLPPITSGTSESSGGTPSTVSAASSAAPSSPASPRPAGMPPPTLAGCAVFPGDNAWNADVSTHPVHPRSDEFIAAIGSGGHLHADFGENQDYGIPFVVARGQRPVPITYTDYGDESDPGPFPIPLDAPIERGSDRHVLAIDADACVLYELFNASRTTDGWQASSGARWPLDTNRLRPEGWTSADAAGLPILPGLARHDEVASGAIRHALRFTAARTQRGYVHPATHFASSSRDPSLPPMGLRVRLKASYDIGRFHGQARMVLEALRRYGMLLADNGSNWFISGATHPGWDDDDLNQLKSVPGSAFEAVDTGPIRTG